MSVVAGPLTPSELAFENEKTKRVNNWVLHTHKHQHVSPNSPSTPPISATKSLPPHPTRKRPAAMNNMGYPGSMGPVPVIDPRMQGYNNVVYPPTPYPQPTMVPMSAPIQHYPMSTPYPPNAYSLPGGVTQNMYGQQPGGMGMQANTNTGFRERGPGNRNPSPEGYNREEGFGKQTNPNFLGTAPGGMPNLYGPSPSMMPQVYGPPPSPIVIVNHPSRSGGGRSRSRHRSHSRPRTHSRSHSRSRSTAYPPRPRPRSGSPEPKYSRTHDRDRDRGRGHSNRDDIDEIAIPRGYVPASPGPDRRSRGSRPRRGSGGGEGEGVNRMDDRLPQHMHMHNPLGNGNHRGAEAAAVAAAAAVGGYALGHHEEKKHGHGHRHGHGHGRHNDHNYGQDLASAFQKLTTGNGGGGAGGAGHSQNQNTGRHRSSSHPYPQGQSGGHPSSSRPIFSRHRSRSIDDRDLQTSRARARYGNDGGNGGYTNQTAGGGGGGYQHQSQPQQPQMYNGPSQTPYQQGGMSQPQGGPNVIHHSFAQATVVPIHDGKGGYMVVPPRGQEVRVLDTTPLYNNNANTRHGFRSKSQPRTAGAQPSFFSRLFGRSGHNSGPRIVQPQPANVQYVHTQHHSHTPRSHKHTKKRRDSY